MNTFADVAYLHIQSYSRHPEVYRMADQIVDSYVSTKKRVHRRKYVRDARKLVASLWFHPSDWFRFSTKRSSYGREKKQVWLTPRVLTLFTHMRDMKPALFRLVKPAIPPVYAKDGRGRSGIYCRSFHFKQSLKMLRNEDIIPDPESDRITFKNNDGMFVSIPREERESEWFKLTERTLINHSETLSRSHIERPDGTLVSVNDTHYIRKFKGSLRVTGRLYASFENWSKEDRLGITFDGVPAMSIDISSLNPVLLLRIKSGIDREPMGLFTRAKEPYDVPGFDYIARGIQKSLINILFNCADETAMVKALISTYWWLDEDGKIVSETYDRPKKRKGLPVFMEKSEEAKRYIRAFRVFHPELAESIGTGHPQRS